MLIKRYQKLINFTDLIDVVCYYIVIELEELPGCFSGNLTGFQSQTIDLFLTVLQDGRESLPCTLSTH